jgi:hypothetical protein
VKKKRNIRKTRRDCSYLQVQRQEILFFLGVIQDKCTNCRYSIDSVSLVSISGNCSCHLEGIAVPWAWRTPAWSHEKYFSASAANLINWGYRNENDDIRKHGSALWEPRKRTCPVRINEDVSPREMGIYHHISAGLLRFIQGALRSLPLTSSGMWLVQYSTPAQGRRTELRISRGRETRQKQSSPIPGDPDFSPGNR